MLAFVITVLSFFALANCNGCKWPPQAWCASDEIARSCGVVEQCRNYRLSDLAYKRSSDATPVSLNLYMESLCPDCRDFMRRQLYPTWQKIGSIMDLRIIPYGNAEETQVGDVWKFDCQHGPEECRGNMLETCAMYLLKDVKIWMPYIACIESEDSAPVETAALKCAARQLLNFTAITTCANSSLGNQLMHANAVETEALQPPHQYVPWVTVNKVHTEDMESRAEKDLLGLMCDTYQGPKPAACPQVSIVRRCWHS